MSDWDDWDLYHRAYKSAERSALQTEFLESFVKHRREGCSHNQAIFSALYEWDIVLILEDKFITPKKKEIIVGNNFKRKLTAAWKKHRKEIKRLRDAGTAWYKIEQYLTLKEGKQVLSGSTIRRYFAEDFEAKAKVAKKVTIDKIKDFDNCDEEDKKQQNILDTLKSVFPDGALKKETDIVLDLLKGAADSPLPNKDPVSDESKYFEERRDYWMNKAKDISVITEWAESGKELTPELRLLFLELFMRHG